VRILMAGGAQRNQVLLAIIALPASGLDVMYLQRAGSSASLATPAVALQYLLA
jgi:hypothetical protein